MEFLKSEMMNTSRRKFLGFLGFLAVAGALVSRFAGKRKKKPSPAKMLTQDGHLVEIDVGRIPGDRRKATNDQVASWIWKNQKL